MTVDPIRHAFAALVLAALSGSAHADCLINFEIRNVTPPGSVGWLKILPDTAVRTQNGQWVPVTDLGWPIEVSVTANTSFYAVLHSPDACETARQYRVTYRCGTQQRATYFPSPTAWTPKKDTSMALSC